LGEQVILTPMLVSSLAPGPASLGPSRIGNPAREGRRGGQPQIRTQPHERRLNQSRTNADVKFPERCLEPARLIADAKGC
jgi:hypothetical protein